MGLALGRWAVVRRGLWSVGLGYLVLALGAALVFALLRLAGVGTVSEFLGNSETKVLADPTLREVLLSSFGTLAGMIMIVAYHRSVIAGPLIVLAIVPAAAMVGIALAAGRPDLAYQGLERFLLDVALIVFWRTLVLALKQAPPPQADGVARSGFTNAWYKTDEGRHRRDLPALPEGAAYEVRGPRKIVSEAVIGVGGTSWS